ncbi:MAG: hypothetical protein ACE5JM_11640, partial [Armatimonadota bacterium]
DLRRPQGAKRRGGPLARPWSEMHRDRRGDGEAAEPSGRDDWAAAVALGLLYVVLSIVGHELPLPDSPVSTVVSVIVGLLLLVGVMYYVARIPALPRAALVTGAALLLAWAWLAFLMRAGQARPGLPSAAADVCLAAAAGGLGKFAVRFVNARNLLLPIAVVAAVFDVVYVYCGPLEAQRAIGGRALSESLAPVTAAVTALGGKSIPGATRHGVLGGVGFGDLAILAFFFTAAVRFGMDAARSFWYILPLVVIAFMVAVQYGSVPGWVPIGMGFILANHRFFRFTDEEKRAMLYAGPVVLLLAAALIGASLLLRR